VSTNSIVSRYGHDLNRDFDVLEKIEEILEREVDPVELQTVLRHVGSERITVLQLAHKLQATHDEQNGSPNGSSYYSDEYAYDEDCDYDAPCGTPMFKEDSTDGMEGTPSSHADSSSTWGLECSSRSTPAIPALKLGGLRRGAKPGGGQTSRALASAKGITTRRRESILWQTSRNSLGTSMLRVLLPFTSSHNAHVAASTDRQRLHMSTARLHTAVEQLSSRPSVDDLDQQLPGPRKSVSVQHRPARSRSPSMSPPSDGSGKTASDVCRGADVRGPRDTRVHQTKQGFQVRKDMQARKQARSAIQSFELNPAWWTEYAHPSSGEDAADGRMLPEFVWAALDRLQATALDSMAGRLSQEQQLAQTVYSLVYTAVLDGNQPVVVKKLDLHGNDVLPNALAEICVLEHLQGWSGCVQLIAYSRTSDQVSIVMQRCSQNLRQWVLQQPGKGSRTWARQALRMFVSIAELARDLHERHVAHCDLKLDNVLLSTDGKLLLSDFSEAMLYSTSLQAVLKESRGTEPYQCPEMLMGRPVDACSADCWALGCMLYEIITGRVLFPGQGDCLRPTMHGQALHSARATRRMVRWMSSSEEATLQAAVGDSGALSTRGRGVGDEVLHLLGSILVEAPRRPTSAHIVEQASRLLELAVQRAG